MQANDPKLSDGGAWRGSCEGGAKKEATSVGQRWLGVKTPKSESAATVTRGAVRCSAWLGVSGRMLFGLLSEIDERWSISERYGWHFGFQAVELGALAADSELPVAAVNAAIAVVDDWLRELLEREYSAFRCHIGSSAGGGEAGLKDGLLVSGRLAVGQDDHALLAFVGLEGDVSEAVILE